MAFGVRTRGRVGDLRLSCGTSWNSPSQESGSTAAPLPRMQTADAVRLPAPVREASLQRVAGRQAKKETELQNHEWDDAFWMVSGLVRSSRFLMYSADEIAELTSAFRANDPEELQRIYAYAPWEERPEIDPPPPDCLDCRRPMRFGYPPQCEKHPHKEEPADER